MFTKHPVFCDQGRYYRTMILEVRQMMGILWFPKHFLRPHRSWVSSPRRTKLVHKAFGVKNNRRQVQSLTQIRLFADVPNEGCIMSSEATVTLKSGQKIPCVGLGTWQAKSEEVETAVETALKIGYRHFDTAFNYNNEEAIGRVFSRWLETGKIKRDELFITTKLPHIGNRAKDVEKYLNLSLGRLCLDYLDLYLIHLPFGFMPDSTGEAPAVDEEGSIILDTATDHVATWKAMEEQVKAGKVKGLGLSNFNINQIDHVLNNASIPPSVLQIELHANFQQKPLREYCKNHGIIVTAYSPLGSPGAKQHFIKKYNYSPEKFPDVLGNPEVCKLADKYSKTPAQILLRHLIQSNIVVIPKSSNPQRIKENFELFDFQLKEDEMCILDKLDKGEDGRIFDFFFWKGVENHPQYPFQLKKNTD